MFSQSKNNKEKQTPIYVYSKERLKELNPYLNQKKVKNISLNENYTNLNQIKKQNGICQ